MGNNASDSGVTMSYTAGIQGGRVAKKGHFYQDSEKQVAKI